MMRDLKGKVVVVTGAASGIGREMALAFARRGSRLVVADIDEEGLRLAEEELKTMGEEVRSKVIDVSVAGQVETFCEDLYEEIGRVDVLCNNAGVAVAGWMEDQSLDDWTWILGVNLWGVIHGCYYFYPRMIEQGGGGHIVNTASGAGLIPLPLTISYNTTKYAVVGLSETLRAEAALNGIGVSVLCPGFVATPITNNAVYVSRTERSNTEELQGKIDRFFKRRNYTPNKVAEAVIKGVEDNRAVIVVGPETYLGDFTHRLSRRLYDSVLGLATRLMRERL
ncbi:MAG: SDR family NAD(P)-dependent oxidoreductase [Actinomycetota bacterium]|nr:SDR family NAD(P)-dependent oxidoreductase [Actinomycetota bacterium]